MEFKSLKNIETSFRQIRLFGIVYTAACALVVVTHVGNHICCHTSSKP